MLQTTTPNIFQKHLNRLFASTRATFRDIVDGTGGVIREAYLWQLCTGHAVNPSFKVIAALANYFKLSPGYFFGELDNRDISRLASYLDDNERRKIHQVALKFLLHI